MISFNRPGPVWAGGDGWDCSDASKWSDKLKTYSEDPKVVSAMREAAKRILCTVANRYIQESYAAFRCTKKRLSSMNLHSSNCRRRSMPNQESMPFRICCGTRRSRPT